MIQYIHKHYKGIGAETLDGMTGRIIAGVVLITLSGLIYAGYQKIQTAQQREDILRAITNLREINAEGYIGDIKNHPIYPKLSQKEQDMLKISRIRDSKSIALGLWQGISNFDVPTACQFVDTMNFEKYDIKEIEINHKTQKTKNPTAFTAECKEATTIIIHLKP